MESLGATLYESCRIPIRVAEVQGSVVSFLDRIHRQERKDELAKKIEEDKVLRHSLKARLRALELEAELLAKRGQQNT